MVFLIIVLICLPYVLLRRIKSANILILVCLCLFYLAKCVIKNHIRGVLLLLLIVTILIGVLGCFENA